MIAQAAVALDEHLADEEQEILPLAARLLWRLTRDRVYGTYRDRLRRG